MENSKIKFFKRVFLSVADFDSYQRFAMEKVIVAIKYLLTLMLVFSAIVALISLYKLSTILNSAKRYLETDFPDFEIIDGKLHLESDEEIIIQSDMPQVVIIDTASDSEKLAIYETGIGIFEDKIVLSSYETKIEYSYLELQTLFNMKNVNRQELIQKLNDTNYIALAIIIYISLIISLFIIYTGWTVGNAFIITLLGFIMSRLYLIKMKFTSIVSISFHALTLAIILNIVHVIVNILTGFSVKYFNTIYTAVTSVYVITAILLIRSNIIKQQIALQYLLDQKINKEDEIFKEEDPDKKKEEEKKEEEKDKEKTKEDNKEEKGEAKEGGIA